jgi:hypothetical protein
MPTVFKSVIISFFCLSAFSCKSQVVSSKRDSKCNDTTFVNLKVLV